MNKGNTQRTLTETGKRLLTLFLCIAFFLTACAANEQEPADIGEIPVQTSTVVSTTAASVKKELTPRPYNCNYYDPESFADNIAAAVPYEPDSAVTAAIVPHHAPHMDLACSLLASDAVADASYDAVIVIGPNHTGEGAPIQLTGRGYYWENGAVEGAADIADYIAGDFRLRVGVDTAALGTDHAASVLMPYIAHYLPDVPVTALLLSTAVTPEELENLCEDLTVLSEDKNLLVLFSVDFSHYQTPSDAETYDKETQEAILSGNTGGILSWHNEHFDTPQGVALFVRFAQATEADVRCLDYRFTSFTENSVLQAMSYFVFAAEKAE